MATTYLQSFLRLLPFLTLLLPTSTLAALQGPLIANSTSSHGVGLYTPSGYLTPSSGSSSLFSLAGPTLSISGIRGISPVNGSSPAIRPFPNIQPGDSPPGSNNPRPSSTPLLPAAVEARVKLAFQNLKDVAQYGGAELEDCTRLVVYTTDLDSVGGVVDRVQGGFWKNGTFPPRTMVEVRKLLGEDILELEGTFWIGGGG